MYLLFVIMACDQITKSVTDKNFLYCFSGTFRTDIETVLENLEVFSCTLNQETTTQLSIVDPCHVNFELHRKSINSSSGGSTHITVDVTHGKLLLLFLLPTTIEQTKILSLFIYC